MASDIKPRDLIIFGLLLIFPIIKMFWELYINIRQLLVVEETKTVPHELKRIIPVQTFNLSRFYTLDKLQFHTIISFFELLYSVITFGRFSLYPYWLAATEFAEFLGFSNENELAVSLSFVFHINCMQALIDIPMTYYEFFIIESNYGFNKQTVKEFLVDRLLKFGVTQLVLQPVIACTVFLIKYVGNYLVFYIWIFSSVLLSAAIYLYPTVIAPIFYNIKPYPSAPLKHSFQHLACAQYFPITELYLIEGSKKSEHSNAYLTGIFDSARIVLFDTLLYRKDPVTGKENGLKDAEIFAVICHEMGHWKHSHMRIRIIVILLETFTVCILLAILMPYVPLYEAVGFPPDIKPVIIGLLSVGLLLSPLTTLYGCLTKCVWRFCENEADEFVVNLGYGNNLKKAIYTLQKDNLSFPVNDWLYSEWYRTHPSFLERIRRIDIMESKRH